MQALRSLDRVTGLEPGDHACWAYASATDLAAAAAACLEEGARRGERLLYIGTESEEGLREHLSALVGADDLIDSGRLVLRHVDTVYDSFGGLDGASQVDAFRDEVKRAVDDGCTGLRVVGDVTSLAQTGQDLLALCGYELAVDEMIAGYPMTAVCAYDERRVHEWMGALAALHPLQHRPSSLPTFAVSLRGRTLTLGGEVDSASARVLGQVLAAVRSWTTGPLVIDLRPLDFIDVAGTRVLARSVAATVAQGRETQVRGARAAVRRCLELFGVEVDEAA